jgi:UDP-glucose 4-epimerase
MKNGTHDFKRVLVTGGAGFIGVEMVRQLHARGLSVVVFDLWPQVERARKFIPAGVETVHGSVLDRTALRDAIQGCDAVIHLAAVLGVAKTERNKLHTIEVNVNGTQNVVEIAATHGVKKLTFASSSEVYGEPIESPVKESTPTQGKTVYAVTKMMGEELCKAFNQRYPEFRYTIVRYFNTYGPLQVAEFVLTRFIRAAMVGEAPFINGDGTQLRSYCYCEDSCRGTIDATFSKAADGEVLNLGNSNQRFTLEEAARLVLRVTGREGQIEPVYDRKFERGDRLVSREIFHRICDTTKAQSLIGYEARIPLEEGVRRIVARGEPPETWTPERSVVEHSDSD